MNLPNQQSKDSLQRWGIHYRGSLILGILLGLLWPPLGMALLLKNCFVQGPQGKAYLDYRGSYGWLLFWALLFFPMALLLLMIKGVDLVVAP